MIKAIVVDDEKLILSDLITMIHQTGFIKVIKSYENPMDALNDLDSINPDIAFIDIWMPEMDGLELAERIIEKNPAVKIVFITAYNQYAVKAFDLNALDYVLKPINPKRFSQMIKCRFRLALAVKSTESCR